MDQATMEKKARSCIPNGAVFISVERTEPRKMGKNTIQMFNVIYTFKGEKYRTTLSGQSSGRESGKRKLP